MERPYLSNEREDRSSWQIPWPAKNYSCSFCRREFRSAQALGGHMNVHRRDRARLRLLPSWISEKPYIYPNPNFSSSSSTSLAFMSSSSPFLTFADQNKPSLFSFSGRLERKLAKRKSAEEERESKGLARATEFDQVLKREKIISHDLKELVKNPTEFVDLELRLGCL